MLNHEIPSLLLLLLLLLTLCAGQISGRGRLTRRQARAIPPWSSLGDGWKRLSDFTTEKLTALDIDQTTNRIEIINCTIGTIETDALRTTLTTNPTLKIDNSTIGTWHSQELTAFHTVTIVSSSIEELTTGGINITRPDADKCGRVNTAPSVRIADTSIKTLRGGGIVLRAASGKLELDHSRIETLMSGGVQLSFRVWFTVSGGRIDQLSVGAFCQVCSDVVQVQNIRIHPGRPVEAALSFGSSACREICPKVRQHIRELANILLSSCGEARQLLQALSRCRLGQKLVTGCGDEEGGATEDSGGGGTACDDLKNIADNAHCPVEVSRLVPPDCPWTEPAVIGVVGAGALVVGFLLGMLTLRVCRRSHRRRPRNAADEKKSVPAPSQLSPAPRQSLRRYRDTFSSVWSDRTDSLSRSDVARAGSSQNIYERPLPSEGLYELIGKVETSVDGPGLPRPPSFTPDGTEPAQQEPKQAFLVLPPIPNTTHVYSNLHGSQRRKKGNNEGK